ncbi:MAG: TlpA family protein disulfide reductase [Deltaproteobacteria bacterium]|nr:TlpA family protein disulfide reductase [Deltaproteobacteria bacterium]
MGELSTKYKSGILFFLFVTGILVLFFLIGNNMDFTFTKPPSVAVGTMAPDFSLPDLEGKTVSLSDFRGKLVLLNIWATWCRPCIDEMPSIEKLYKKFNQDDFQILAVSIDTKGKKAVYPFMKLYNLHFKALLDKRGAVQKAYQATGVPESFIIDKNGIIIQKVIGSFDWSSPEIFQYLKKQLDKPYVKKQ